MIPMKQLFAALLLFCGLSARAQNDGDSIFNSSQVHDVYLQFSQASFWDTLTANFTADVYTEADMTFDGVAYPSVGVKLKGNSSYNNPSNKKSIKIDMNNYVSGQKIDGLKKFNLNNGFKDPSFLREKLALDYLNDHGIAAPRCTYARVYLNGTYWGLYTLVEEVNNNFCTQRFGGNDGNRFKGDPSGDLRWYGSAASNYYTHYELDNNSTANDWSDLVRLIDKINNTSSNDFHDSLEAVLNTNTFVNHWAAYNLFVNLDSYIGSGHNYFIYHDTVSDKFEWIQWDVNESFGNFNLMMSVSQLENLSWNYLNQANNKPLCNKMLQNSTYTTLYQQALCNLAHDFTNAALDAKIDSLANAIRTDVYADTQKFFTNQDFETNLTSDVGQTAGIKSFITARHNSLTSQLSAFGCWLSVNEQASATAINAYPNPFSASTTIALPASWDGSAAGIQLTDMSGRDVSGAVVFTKKTEEIQVANRQLPPGMYIAVIRIKDHEPVYIRLSVAE